MTKINKEGWEIKKLGEVATFLNGFAFKPEQWEEEGLPIIRIQNLNTPTAPYNYCSQSLDEKYIVKNGDLLISWSASLGSYIWEGDEAYLNQHIFKVVFDKMPIDKMFLKYLVTSKLEEMTSLVHGATMKHITKKNFDNIKVCLPPLPIQQRIVDELDEINAIISAKKQQLSKLDELAQSIFYNMFGDPVANEKGWEVKTWEYVFDTRTGKLDSNAMVPDGKYPFFTCAKDVYKINHYAFDCGALLLAGNNASGDYDVKHYKGKFNAYQRTYVLTLQDTSQYYTIFKMQLEWRLKELKRKSLGIGTKYLTMKILKSISFILPPLPLQEAFAARVTAIEEEKAAIAASIEKMQTLLDARMQEYFG